MPADALDSEIEPVRDRPVKSSSAVDRHLAVDLVPREDHHRADRVADPVERFDLVA